MNNGVKKGPRWGWAISLQASDNPLRNKIVPVNERFPLEPLPIACQEYFEVSRHRIIFEYVLFQGIIYSIRQTRSLALSLRELKRNIDSIPAKHTANDFFREPPYSRVLTFHRELLQMHVPCTVRQRKGLDIDAGCGQLRASALIFFLDY